MPTRQVTIQGVMTWDEGPNYPSQGPGFPTHPIAPGGRPPLGIWGGVAPPYPDQGLPGQPPSIWPSPGHPDNSLPGQPNYPSQGPGFPTNPIAPGGQPPSIWPSPGHPSNPISGGGYVIGWSPVYGYVWIPLGGANPGGGNRPDQGLPGSQPYPDHGLPDSPPDAQPK